MNNTIKKVKHAFISISTGRTFVTLSNGATAGFPHFPDGVNCTDKSIAEAREWAKERSKTQEERDER